MATPAEIIDMVASLQNDTAQTQYNNVTCLPYLNMALDELQEIFEQNNVPITNEVSAALSVAAGVTSIGFTATTPTLPADLVEIQQLWESPTGLDIWTPVTKLEFLPHFYDGIVTNQFVNWAWVDQHIQLPTTDANNDLKLDYIKYIFSTPILIANIDVDLNVLNSKSYLGYKTAALCSMYIGENETRAGALNAQAEEALSRVLGINTKGRQSISTRRRPFRASYKVQGIW